MGAASSSPCYAGVALPTNIDSSPLQPEFCTRMQFKLTPTYSSQLQARLKWQQVLRAAQQRQGGGWQPDFDPADLTPERLGRLVDVIDAAFLRGSFKRTCAPSFQVCERLQPASAGALQPLEICNAVAGFEPATNTISVYRSGFGRQNPSLAGKPVQADGVYCLSRLEWLSHTLAHEMVHCIVHNVCPDSRNYLAYTADNGHGPIFTRLNRSLFGHCRTQYRSGWGRLPDAGLKVQWGCPGADVPAALSLPLGAGSLSGSSLSGSDDEGG